MVKAQTGAMLHQVYLRDRFLAFIVFINDIDGCTDNLMKISKFADDTKLSHQQEDHHHIHEALYKLVDWADTWGHGFQHSQVQGSSYREKQL